MKWKVLSKMQQKFCHEYINNGHNAKQAAIDAGYRRSDANYTNAILAQRRVREYMNEIQDEHLSNDAITAAWKLAKLRRITELCVPADAEHYLQINAKDAISAIKEANLMQGHYAPTQTESKINTEFPGLKDLIDTQEEIIKSYKKDY